MGMMRERPRATLRPMPLWVRTLLSTGPPEEVAAAAAGHREQLRGLRDRGLCGGHVQCVGQDERQGFDRTGQHLDRQARHATVVHLCSVIVR